MSGSEKKWTGTRTTRVPKKFLEVARSSRAKQRQRNVQKKRATRAKLLLLIRPNRAIYTRKNKTRLT